MSDDEHPKAAAPTPLAGVASADTHGDEPMTSHQAAELRTLCERAGEPFDGALSRAQAAERIDWLKSRL